MLAAPEHEQNDELEDRSWWAQALCATGGAGLGLARLGGGELMPRMAAVALGLVVVAGRAAGRDLALLQRGPGVGLDVGDVVDGVRRMAVGPLLLRPDPAETIVSSVKPFPLPPASRLFP